MSEAKYIRLVVSTGFYGADYIEEVEYEGQTLHEIEAMAEEFRDQIVAGDIQCLFEMLDEDGCEIDE